MATESTPDDPVLAAWRERVTWLEARMAARAKEDAIDMTEHEHLTALLTEAEAA